MVHLGNVQSRIMEARQCLELAGRYMENLNEEAERLANTTVTDERLQEILKELFPVKDSATDREKNSVKKMKDEFMIK